MAGRGLTPLHGRQHGVVPAVTSGYVPVEGGRLYDEIAGQGPALVLIHDGLLHSETWNEQFAPFARSFRVVRWDRRGYGRSDEPRATFSDIDEADIPDVHTHVGAIQAGVSGATRVVLPGAGHLNLEVPALFNAEVLKFLR
ncbi:MAG: alpha/beta fold hydrolase [Acidobacteriota bacterium]